MSKYTKDEIAAMSAQVLDGMESGLSLRKSCLAAGVMISSFLRWCDNDKELADQYASVREELIEKMADELLEISDEEVGSTANGSTDNGAVAKQRLRVDTRKWLLSKLAAKKYGDKVESTVVGADGAPLEIRNIIVQGVTTK